MHDIVKGFVAATLEDAVASGDLERVTADLEVFLRAVETSDLLRNALSDPSVPARARRGIVEDLLSGRAAPEAGALASFAARIERATDLPVAIAQLLEAAAGAPDSETPGWGVIETDGGGRLAVRDRVHGYAERVLGNLGDIAAVDTVEDELFRIARILEANADLREALSDPEVPYVRKARLVDDLFGSRVAPSTGRLVRFVVRAGRLRDLVGTIEWLVEIAAAERGRRVAEVRSAVDLDASERTRLASALGRVVDRNVEVRVIVDPAVIGGAFVSVGDLVIDGTVRQRFERLRDVLEQKS